MKKTKPAKRRPTKEQVRQWRKDREQVARELPALIAKHDRICTAAEESTTSGALRRAIHSSKILLHDLAKRADTDIQTLDAFLTGRQSLTSEVIDRLTRILKLKLEPIGGAIRRRAQAG